MRSGVKRVGCLMSLAAVVWLGACGCEQPAAAGLDAAGIPDARPDRREWPPFPDASLPDADLRDAWQPGPFPDAEPCDASFIALPPTGASFISVVSNSGRWVAYDYDQTPNILTDRTDVYLYDLQTCTEHRITNQPNRTQWQPWVWRDHVVFSNEFADHRYTITTYDIVTNTFRDFASIATPVISILGAVDDFIAYAPARTYELYSPQDDMVLNVASGDSTFLESTTDGSSSGGDISETHYTWPSLILNEYKGIWVYDFATDQKELIQGSDRGCAPSTGGDWLVWEDWRTNMPDIWGVRLGSGETVHVTDNGANNSDPRLRGNLLCFRTTLWSGNAGWDLAVMDMDTWAVRRVTQNPYPGYRCGHIDGGWLVYRVDPADWGYSLIYAKNLVAWGILDAQGHVIP